MSIHDENVFIINSKVFPAGADSQYSKRTRNYSSAASCIRGKFTSIQAQATLVRDRFASITERTPHIRH